MADVTLEGPAKQQLVAKLEADAADLQRLQNQDGDNIGRLNGRIQQLEAERNRIAERMTRRDGRFEQIMALLQEFAPERLRNAATPPQRESPAPAKPPAKTKARKKKGVATEPPTG